MYIHLANYFQQGKQKRFAENQSWSFGAFVPDLLF